MTKYIFVLTLFTCSFAIGQNSFKAIIKNGETKEILVGASAQLINSSNEKTSNEKGFLELNNIPNGIQKIKFSKIGYEPKTETYTFPVNDTIQIVLTEKGETILEEVVIESTRTSRSIKNTPTRVETIEAEELEEKGNMKPANISMVLHESTGLQVQQTSATSGNASIRVQGLDGRYT